MCKNIGDLDYTDEEALNLGAYFEELKDARESRWTSRATSY